MAGSIKLFQFVQKIHQTVGIYPSLPNQKQCSINLRNKIALICIVEMMLTSGGFFAFEAKSMFEYGFGFYMLICMINNFVMYVVFIWQLENLFKFFENCDRFIGKREQSTITYKEINDKIELFNKLFFYGTCVSVVFCICTPLPYSFVRYFIYDMGEKSFYLGWPVWVPFDWKTPFGYLIAFFGECAGSVVTVLVYTQFLNIVFGTSWLFINFAKDIMTDLVAFNTAVQTPNENRIELTKRFCKVMQSYTDAKECVMAFNQIFEYPLFSFFAWNMLAVASGLITLQFQLWEGLSLFEISPIGVLLTMVVWYIFLLCEPGAQMTIQFERFGDELDRCDWHLLPNKMQRMYISFLSDTQRPIKLSSFANITCERETEKKIFSKAFSYFMTFRNFRP